MIYKSCRLLEHGIYFYLDPGTGHLIAGHCCNTDNLEFKDRLYLYFDLKNEKLDWSYIFNEKKKLRENAKKGIYPAQCEGCFELQERNWDDNDYINHLTAGHIMKCNSRCVYCPTGRIPEWHNREQDIDIKPIIKELLEKKLLRFDGSLRFVGGEPTLMKEFDWLVELFSKNNVPEIYVPTSGIRLSKSLCNALEKIDSAAIVTSIDSGCEKTFEKIKGTKFYNLVLKNMKTYLNHSKEKNFVISKFILFTNYNDSAKEIEKWLFNCKKIGLVEVQFDSEHSVSSSESCENKKYINRTLKMLKYTEKLAPLYNLKVTSFLAFMNRAQRIYEKQLQFYNENKDKFIDLYLNDQIENINNNKYYNDLHIDIYSLKFKTIEEQINSLIEEEKFSPIRKIYTKISKPIEEETRKKLILFLRLGFDFDIEIENYIEDEVIDEIIKTSHSQITYIRNKNIFNFLKNKKLKNKYEKITKLGNVYIK